MPLTRRRFLKLSGSIAAATWTYPSVLWGDEALKASRLVAGKSDAMGVLKSDPIVLETPLAMLDRHRLTPSNVLFVRNNGDLDGSTTVDPAPRQNWSVELVGLVEGTRSIQVDELARLPQTEVELVLQCSGNGRSLYSRTVPTSGTQWGIGGIGNVRFAGVKLTTVLEHLKVQPRKLARYVAAEGKDTPKPGTDDFEHSIPLGDVLDRAILALSLNGQPLPAIHGGPVRLVTPGYYGTVNIKWLTRLRFEESESTNTNHSVRYRMPLVPIKPGTPFVATLDNSTPTWRMKIASMVTSHSDGQRVQAGKVPVAGYAWNDGMVPLTAVVGSTDHGETWRRFKLDPARSPYAWSRWSAELNLPRGNHTIWIAAVDALGRTQPLDGAITWNPSGYEWNGIPQLTLVAE